MYACRICETHLSSECQIISKSFQGRGGKAYLMDQVVNVYLGLKETRKLMTGNHEVADIFCIDCHTLAGWTYIAASETSQKYKEGHFILEKKAFKSV